MMMTTKIALSQLGVREDTLTSEEKGLLDGLGFVIFKDILTTEQVIELRQHVDRIAASEGVDAGKEEWQESSSTRVCDLLNKASVFDILITQTRVLAAICHVLDGDLKLSSLNSRIAGPGQGLQELHADWGRLHTPGEYQVCDSLWPLDDFTVHNGATRFVPGSHKFPNLPRDVMDDPCSPHPDEIILPAKAGDVVIFNSHAWHGGTLNQTDCPRRVIHGFYSRRYFEQQCDQQKYITPSTWNRLNEPLRFLIDVK